MVLAAHSLGNLQLLYCFQVEELLSLALALALVEGPPALKEEPPALKEEPPALKEELLEEQ